MIASELQVAARPPRPRQTQVLRLVGIAPSSWHRVPHEGARKRPGPPPRPLSDEVVTAVVEMATTYPWYGYKKIAIMCRRDGQAVVDRLAAQPHPRAGLAHAGLAQIDQLGGGG